MANRTITIQLPDGREDALIQEFAEAQGWTAEEGPVGPFVKSIFANVFRDVIKSARQRAIIETAQAVEEEDIQ